MNESGCSLIISLILISAAYSQTTLGQITPTPSPTTSPTPASSPHKSATPSPTAASSRKSSPSATTPASSPSSLSSIPSVEAPLTSVLGPAIAALGPAIADSPVIDDLIGSPPVPGQNVAAAAAPMADAAAPVSDSSDAQKRQGCSFWIGIGLAFDAAILNYWWQICAVMTGASSAGGGPRQPSVSQEQEEQIET